ncbi:hypothetical protein CsSME_00000039 [Camellia sinensis var. sinensis]
MIAKEGIRTRAYEEGFFDGRKIGIEKTMEKLADDVCQYENRGFKHGWIKALQVAGIDSASLLYQNYKVPFEVYDTEKKDDEEEGADPEMA